VALTDDEAVILSLGYSPVFVRPANLVAYWPLVGRSSPEPDIVGGYDMTLVGSPTVADHPRIIYSTSDRLGLTAATAATNPLLPEEHPPLGPMNPTQPMGFAPQGYERGETLWSCAR
jgi:hypothetical protein